jgi:hypothetical protein
MEKSCCLNPSSKENSSFVIWEPSKQGSQSSPKIQSFETIASFIIKNYGFPLSSFVHVASK